MGDNVFSQRRKVKFPIEMILAVLAIVLIIVWLLWTM